MPYMNGLEAIRDAQASAPDTLFYILTGFDDFSYAREALRLHVKDYLLKPIRRTELEGILEEVISQVEQRKGKPDPRLKALHCLAVLRRRLRRFRSHASDSLPSALNHG